ncbi:hypothetical protein RJ641_008904 [Dillenia turbinata]|uniref:Uncharacterized protein n=1 Tax=Dillenia turbinata TaxID=194707 RepID=A0AAN8V458_9MAGN
MRHVHPVQAGSRARASRYSRHGRIQSDVYMIGPSDEICRVCTIFPTRHHTRVIRQRQYHDLK